MDVGGGGIGGVGCWGGRGISEEAGGRLGEELCLGSVLVRQSGKEEEGDMTLTGDSYVKGSQQKRGHVLRDHRITIRH